MMNALCWINGRRVVLPLLMISALFSTLISSALPSAQLATHRGYESTYMSIVPQSIISFWSNMTIMLAVVALVWASSHSFRPAGVVSVTFGALGLSMLLVPTLSPDIAGTFVWVVASIAIILIAATLHTNRDVPVVAKAALTVVILTLLFSLLRLLGGSLTVWSQGMVSQNHIAWTTEGFSILAPFFAIWAWATPIKANPRWVGYGALSICALLLLFMGLTAYGGPGAVFGAMGLSLTMTWSITALAIFFSAFTLLSCISRNEMARVTALLILPLVGLHPHSVSRVLLAILAMVLLVQVEKEYAERRKRHFSTAEPSAAAA